MMDCFVPVKPIKFELAVKEELPELYENLTKYLADGFSADSKDFVIRLYFSMELLKLLEDLYNKEGREGLRNFRKTQILANAAHENSHEDSDAPVNTGMARGS